MNMRGDNLVKRRGKTKQFRGPIGNNTWNSMRMSDFSWGSESNIPKNLIHPFPIKGHWTFPKRGFIQWKLE